GARTPGVRASRTGAADGLVVAIDGLLRVDAPDRADLQPSTSYRVAWRARILSQKALRNLSAFSTARAFSSQQSRAPHDACSRVHRRDQPEARLRDLRPRRLSSRIPPTNDGALWSHVGATGGNPRQ